MEAREFEESIAVCNLLPGPASTQLAILCARRVAGRAGAIVGGLAFILPGFAAMVVLAALFLGSSPPGWVLAIGAGAGASIAAIALSAGINLSGTSWLASESHFRWIVYVSIGAVTAMSKGPFVVVALLACGFTELAVSHIGSLSAGIPVFATVGVASTSGLAALAWVAFKVGALSYGGGFVIVPLMQHDAVSVHHWMTDSQFLNAVALGQVTPGPVVLTVAAVGYAASGVSGAILATAVAFTPSFVFILGGAGRLDRLRGNPAVRSFLGGAGPAAIGAILGAAVPLAMTLTRWWQGVILVAAALWMVVLRRGVVSGILGAGVVGLVAYLVGAPLP